MKTLAASLALAFIILAPAAGAQEFKTHESQHYTLHTDLPDPHAREATLRLTKMAQMYLDRMDAFVPRIDARLPVYLYRDVDDYENAGGARGSAGAFDGKKLIVLAIRTTDGRIASATWRTLQHEGFHQFARAAIGQNLPTWAEEGLAEYFAECIFTGDGFITGIVPQERLARLRAALKDAHTPLKQFLSLPRETWNTHIDRHNYDLAWSLVHFFANTGQAKYRDSFDAFLKEIPISKHPAQTFARHFGPIEQLEKSWRDYWLALPDHPAADRYARATVAMLTSFLARCHLRGQRFAHFDHFLATPLDKLPFDDENWLPPTLWRMAVDEVRLMLGEGAAFRLTLTGDLPAIELTTPAGALITGKFTLEGRNLTGVTSHVHRR